MKQNLPVPQKNKFIAKLKKMIFIALSSIGLAGNITAPVQASQTNNIQEANSKENSFKENLKVKTESERIADEMIKFRKVKGLGEYSQITNQGESVKEQIVQLFDTVDKNFDRNAKRKGSNEISKNEYKNSLIQTIKRVSDIIFVDDINADNEYAEYFRNKSTVTAYYSGANNIIALRGDCTDAYTMVHELQHAVQNYGQRAASYRKKAYLENLKKSMKENNNNDLDIEELNEENFFLNSTAFWSIFCERA